MKTRAIAKRVCRRPLPRSMPATLHHKRARLRLQTLQEVRDCHRVRLCTDTIPIDMRLRYVTAIATLPAPQSGGADACCDALQWQPHQLPLQCEAA